MVLDEVEDGADHAQHGGCGDELPSLDDGQVRARVERAAPDDRDREEAERRGAPEDVGDRYAREM
jgi:hypothetical protein